MSKIAVMKDGILFSRSRILDGRRYVKASGFPDESLGQEVNLNLMTPVIDRFSPLAVSIAWHIHKNVALHAGYETAYRLSLEHCHIMQGVSLFRQIADQCSKCCMLRKKYLDVCMGPVSDHQLTLCPAFHTAYCDLDGPYFCYVPGFEKETRNRKSIASRNYIMSFACPITKAINLQVIETKTADGILEGLSRLSCEVGCPKYLIIDQESSIMKAFKEVEIEFFDLQHRLFKEKGIICEVSPVSAHNYSGLIERKIRSVQETFSKIDLKSKRLHSTGLQTFAKQVECYLNNMPLGFSYGRSDDNTPLLKVITPNLLRIGRLHHRNIAGPLRFPTGPKDIMKNVLDIYDSFFKVYDIAVIPKLIPQPKWFRDSPEIKVDDVVYFRKSESDMSSRWTVGQIDSVTRSKDGIVRRADVRYFNHGENKPRITDRGVRSLVRLFNVEDNYFIEDMNQVERFIKGLDEKHGNVSVVENEAVPSVVDTKIVDVQAVPVVDVQKVPVVDVQTVPVVDEEAAQVDGKQAKVKPFHVVDVKSKPQVCKCCCRSHCKMNREKRSKHIKFSFAAYFNCEEAEVAFPYIYDEKNEDDVAAVDDSIRANVGYHGKDEIFDVLTALETKFDLEEDEEKSTLPSCSTN